MSKIGKYFRLLFRDPALLLRKTGNRIRPWVVRIPREPVRKKVNGVWFNFDFRLGPSLESMYLGLYEVPLVEALRRHLKEGDTFLDVGANIGYLSALAAGFVGPGGAVHSFEPVPRCFRRLAELAETNPDYRIVPNDCAVGEQEGMAEISVTSSDNIGWHTMVPDFMNPNATLEKLPVKVIRLDRYIREKKLDRIALIKIDAEGFELPVIRGLSGFLTARRSALPVLVVEVAPEAYPKLGTSLGALAELMESFGYQARTLDEDEPVNLPGLGETTNVLFKAARS